MAEGRGLGAVAPVLAVAVSGGRDSTALLHAAWRQSQGTPLQVVALHVHHGLMAEADAWVEHLGRQCARWRRSDPRIRLQVQRLTGGPAAGESVEAWARRERYQALANMARDAGATEIWLAHHRRDQAETVLLQALRGSGAAGLSAMPSDTIRHGLRWVRPWLNRSADEIDAYVARHRLSHIVDSSNGDARFARNRLRLSVMPALCQAFPQAEQSLLGVAFQAQWATALQDEISRADLVALGADAQSLPVTAWLELSAVRRRYALKRWLIEADPMAHSDALLERLLRELPTVKHIARWPISATRGLCLYRGMLTMRSGEASTPANPVDRNAPDWPRLLACAHHRLPEAGSLEVRPSVRNGIPPLQLQQAVWRWREGGEQWQSNPGSTPRSLKKQFQARGVPAWARDHPILVDALTGLTLFVPSLGTDARAMAPDGAEQWELVWHPAAASMPTELSDPPTGPSA